MGSPCAQRPGGYGRCTIERSGELVADMATVTQAWQRVTRNDHLVLFFLALVVGTAAAGGR